MPELSDLQLHFDTVVNTEQPETVEKVSFDFEELYQHKDRVTEFIIDELIPKNSVAMFIGEDGIGKTQIMVQLCLSISTKQPTFLTLPLKCKHNRTMAVFTETSGQKFIVAAAKQINNLIGTVNPKEVHLKFVDGGNVDTLDELCNEVEKNLKETGYDLIVVDAMSDLFVMMDGDINNSTHARQIITKFQRLCTKYDTTVIIIHHVAKTKIDAKRKDKKLFIEKNDQQGAGSITQKPRTVLALSHDPRTLSDNNGQQSYDNFLHVVKANEMGPAYKANGIQLQFDNKTLLHKFKAITNLQSYEHEAAGGEPMQQNGQQQNNPGQLSVINFSYEEHRAAILAVFSKETTLLRDDLIKRMKSVYDCNTNKITEANGMLQQVQTLGLITKPTKGKYVLSVIVDEVDQAKQESINFENQTENEDDQPF